MSATNANPNLPPKLFPGVPYVTRPLNQSIVWYGPNTCSSKPNTVLVIVELLLLLSCCSQLFGEADADNDVAPDTALTPEDEGECIHGIEWPQ